MYIMCIFIYVYVYMYYNYRCLCVFVYMCMCIIYVYYISRVDILSMIGTFTDPIDLALLLDNSN